jgi:hypothetical protein
MPLYYHLPRVKGNTGVNLMAKKKEAKEYTAQEIVDMVNKKQSSIAFSELFDQMDADFDLFSLKPYTAETGHQAYTSPKPKNDFQKVFNGVNKASLTWNIAIPESAPPTERDQANKGEQILTGILAQADENLSAIGEPPLREGASWFGCGRGALGLKCLIYNDESKETVIDIQYTDPEHMAWERGQKGYVWMAYEYPISKAEAQEKYGVELVSEEGRVIDWFDRKNNAVVLVDGTIAANTGNQFVKKPEPHGLDHVPMWIEFAGGMPSVFNKQFQQQLKHRAASVWSSSRKIYEPFDKQVSFIMDTAEKSVAGTLKYMTETGAKGIEGDPFGNWKVIKMKKGEELSALDPPKVPPESGVILGIIDKDLQQSTVPYPIGYGLDPQAHSGAALSMINDNTRSIYDPFTSLIERAWKWLCKEIFIQFKAKGQKLTLKGFNSDGKFYQLEATPADIQDGWYIQVKCEPKLPRDEAGELQMALSATNPRGPDGRPFISDYTAYEKILKLQNPDAEDTRIEEQQVSRMIERMPNIQIRKVAKELVKKGDLEGAKELLAMMPNPQGGGQQEEPGAPGAATGQPTEQPAGQPQLTPQQLEQAAAMAAALQKQGKPIPPELQQILAQAQNMPAPQ